MTAIDLERAALEIYGKGWRTSLCEDLDVDKSSLRRWIREDRVPKTVELAVEYLCMRSWI
jgi:hypothetical protein